jgi:hypothetical protein
MGPRIRASIYVITRNLRQTIPRRPLALSLYPDLMGIRSTAARAALALMIAGTRDVSPASAADRCADLAKPAVFDEHTAMTAIFCEYDRAKGGTLLPLEHTKTWDMAHAETLVSPMLAATYVESGAEKGVLVVQRQSISEGEIEISHATSAVVSVYVFKHAGAVWQFEKGAKEALVDAGVNGRAPGAELIKLGDDKFGLWFRGGDITQGFIFAYAYIVTLSTPTIAQVAELDMGQGNPGACSDNPKERTEFIHKCWDYKGRRDLIRVKGQEYFTLRITYKGTDNLDPTNDKEIVAKNDPVCYDFLDGEYAEMDDPDCKGYKPLPDKDVLVGKTRDEKKAPIDD